MRPVRFTYQSVRKRFIKFTKHPIFDGNEPKGNSYGRGWGFDISDKYGNAYHYNYHPHGSDFYELEYTINWERNKNITIKKFYKLSEFMPILYKTIPIKIRRKLNIKKILI